MGKHYSHPHRSKAEILRDAKVLAKSKRMASITPWSVLQVITSYDLMVTEGFKGQKLLKIANAVNEYEERWQNYEIEVEPYADRVMEKGGFKTTNIYHTADEVTKTRDKYADSMQKLYIESTNIINWVAHRYFTWFYNVLIDLGFGEQRLNRNELFIEEMYTEYGKNKMVFEKWKRELLENAHFCADNPIDPLTGKKLELSVGGRINGMP